MPHSKQLENLPFLPPGKEYQGNLVRNTSEMTERLSLAIPEEILEPELRIIDAHHHLMDSHRSNIHYLLDNFSADLSVGHNIYATVFVDSHAMYRPDGPKDLQVIGEVEFARDVASMASSAPYSGCKVAEAIVGGIDLRINSIERVLEAAIQAGDGRYCGVRHSATFHDSIIGDFIPYPAPRQLLGSSDFRRGYSCLEKYHLSFDAWVFHSQLEELIELIDLFPNVPVALNHIGAPLGVGPYSGRHSEVFSEWSMAMQRLSKRENVSVKIGGMGMPLFGFDFHSRKVPPHSTELASAWQPYVETCIDLFGSERCMFESNFPMDKQSYGYAECWNAFKRLTVNYTKTERNNLFFLTASNFYKIK